MDIEEFILPIINCNHLKKNVELLTIYYYVGLLVVTYSFDIRYFVNLVEFYLSKIISLHETHSDIKLI